MYLSMLKLKQRFEMEMTVGAESVDFLIPEDWMADLTPGDVILFLRM
jgi:hypothetical protein